MKLATKKRAKEVWERNVDLTEWKDTNDTLLSGKPIEAKVMYYTFLEKGFGRAEANCIVAALIMAGAKFQDTNE